MATRRRLHVWRLERKMSDDFLGRLALAYFLFEIREGLCEKEGCYVGHEKISSQLLSSKLRAWSADLSKIRIGPAGMSHDTEFRMRGPRALLRKAPEQSPQLRGLEVFGVLPVS